jgi:arylsulfatase
VPKGVTLDTPSTHTDVVPTLFNLAQIPLHEDFDGTPMQIGHQTTNDVDHINLEFWGPAYPEGKYPQPGKLIINSALETC